MNCLNGKLRFFCRHCTAANSLALVAVNRPGGVTVCQREAHMIKDECGAPEFFTHVPRLAPVDGENGKIDPENLTSEIAHFPADFIHAAQPMAISITQATEIGSVYNVAEITKIATIGDFQASCRKQGVNATQAMMLVFEGKLPEFTL